MSIHTQNLVKAIHSKDEAAIKAHFQSAVREKVNTIVEVEKIKIANAVFNKTS